MADKAYYNALIGFFLAVLASFFFGVGSFVAGITAQHYADDSTLAIASLDISLAHFFSGTLVLFAVAVMSNPRKIFFEQFAKLFFSRRIMLAALFKGINGYIFCASVAFINASLSATIENLYVIWAGALAFFMTRKTPESTWVYSGIAALMGVFFIMNPVDLGHIDSVVGVSLALIASISFALFLLFYRNDEIDEQPMHIRALNSAMFMLQTAIVIYVIHLIVGRHIFGGNVIPFTSIDFAHLSLQFVNGIFNIGATFFLIAEALRAARKAGPYAIFLVGIGLSYAVFFTFVSEYVWESITITTFQMIGVALFTVAIGIMQISEKQRSRRIRNTS
uniref:EamA-like transporter family protein n=1 Tax=Candidatus Kentrum sp. LFY TaxID=2126342 RepID=A0A450UMD3_9GAMM|nr:MAG: hypothetical protein BECKLFY1418A_GA0070994_103319 [Candidatus Kentron sp. LFY]